MQTVINTFAKYKIIFECKINRQIWCADTVAEAILSNLKVGAATVRSKKKGFDTQSMIKNIH